LHSFIHPRSSTALGTLIHPSGGQKSTDARACAREETSRRYRAARYRSRARAKTVAAIGFFLPEFRSSLAR